MNRERKLNTYPEHGLRDGIVDLLLVYGWLLVQMDEVCFDIEAFVLRQAIARAADMRSSFAQADSRQEAATAAAVRPVVGEPNCCRFALPHVRPIVCFIFFGLNLNILNTKPFR